MGGIQDLIFPSRLGRFQLRNLLGRGGMGAVLRAYDTHLERDVALKVLLWEVSSCDPDAVEMARRFDREVRAQAAIHHPNVVGIYDTGRQGDLHYFAMELLRGQTLRDLLAHGGPLPVPRVIALGIDLAAGVGELHAQAIVHRDLKPPNVFACEDGRFVVMDLGLAKATESTLLTAQGALLGTPRFLPPEVIAGTPHDARSDIYQIGVILLEAATAKLAFGDGDVAQMIRSIMAGRCAAMRAMHQVAAPALERIIAWAMAVQPADRPPSAGALGAALIALRDGRPLPVPPGEPARDEVQATRPGARVVTPISSRGRRPSPPPHATPVAVTRGPARRRSPRGRLSAALLGVCIVLIGTLWAVSAKATRRAVARRDAGTPASAGARDDVPAPSPRPRTVRDLMNEIGSRCHDIDTRLDTWVRTVDQNSFMEFVGASGRQPPPDVSGALAQTMTVLERARAMVRLPRDRPVLYACIDPLARLCRHNRIDVQPFASLQDKMIAFLRSVERQDPSSTDRLESRVARLWLCNGKDRALATKGRDLLEAYARRCLSRIGPGEEGADAAHEVCFAADALAVVAERAGDQVRALWDWDLIIRAQDARKDPTDSQRWTLLGALKGAADAAHAVGRDKEARAILARIDREFPKMRDERLEELRLSLR